jgi:hypothetical protein
VAGKMRRLRRHIKGWHINVEGAYRKEKKMLLERLDILDKKEEHTPLTVQKKYLQVEMHNRLKKLPRDEDIKWRHRAKEKDVKEGDGNTRYFHLKASGRRKKTIYQCFKIMGKRSWVTDTSLTYL